MTASSMSGKAPIYARNARAESSKNDGLRSTLPLRRIDTIVTEEVEVSRSSPLRLEGTVDDRYRGNVNSNSSGSTLHQQRHPQPPTRPPPGPCPVTRQQSVLKRLLRGRQNRQFTAARTNKNLRRQCLCPNQASSSGQGETTKKSESGASTSVSAPSTIQDNESSATKNNVAVSYKGKRGRRGVGRTRSFRFSISPRKKAVDSSTVACSMPSLPNPTPSPRQRKEQYHNYTHPTNSSSGLLYSSSHTVTEKSLLHPNKLVITSSVLQSTHGTNAGDTEIYVDNIDDDLDIDENEAYLPSYPLISKGSTLDQCFSYVLSTLSPDNEDDVEYEDDDQSSCDDLRAYELTRNASTATSYTLDTTGRVSPAISELSSTAAAVSSSGLSKKKKKKKKDYYYKDEDFDTLIWKTAAGKSWETSVGMAVVATATVVVHPLLFLAGAVWAVGLFHAMEQGYKFYSDGTFAELFWSDDNGTAEDALRQSRRHSLLLSDDRDDAKKVSDCIPSTHNSTNDTDAASTSENASEQCNDSSGDQQRLGFSEHNASQQEASSVHPGVANKTVSGPIRQTLDASAPAVDAIAPTLEQIPAASPSAVETVATPEQVVKAHFPPLEVLVVSNIPFPNLHAAEFFRVFFSDHAPYSLKDFQAERGDIEINFGNWEAPCLTSDECDFGIPPPIQRTDTSVKERSMSFKTLTKSYFGPAYASAQKKQRVTCVKEDCMVVESRTRLVDIPYGDRFQVIDRWVVQTVRPTKKIAESNTSGQTNTATSGLGRFKKKVSRGQPEDQYSLVSYLTVYLEVKMLRDCSWEAQIRKRSESTMRELTTSWCKKAIAALQVAEQHKAERIQKEQGLSGAPNTNATTGAALVHSKNAEEQLDISQDTQTSFSRSDMNKENRINSNVVASSSTRNDTVTETTGEQLMAMHKRKLQEIEEGVATGQEQINVEKCDSVEIKHMRMKSGQRSVLILGCSNGVGREDEVVQSMGSPHRKHKGTETIEGAHKRKSMVHRLRRRN